MVFSFLFFFLYIFWDFIVCCTYLMVSRFSGYITGVVVGGLEHKQKLDLRLGLDFVVDLGLMNILIAGSFG